MMNYWDLPARYFDWEDRACEAIGILSMNGNSWIAMREIETDVVELHDAEEIFEYARFYPTTDALAIDMAADKAKNVPTLNFDDIPTGLTDDDPETAREGV